MPDDIERKLANFKEDIEEAKKELNILEGEKSSETKRLKEEYEFDDTGDAKKHLKGLEMSIVDLEERLEESVKQIEEKYESA